MEFAIFLLLYQTLLSGTSYEHGCADCVSSLPGLWENPQNLGTNGALLIQNWPSIPWTYRDSIDAGILGDRFIYCCQGTHQVNKQLSWSYRSPSHFGNTVVWSYFLGLTPSYPYKWVFLLKGMHKALSWATICNRKGGISLMTPRH